MRTQSKITAATFSLVLLSGCVSVTHFDPIVSPLGTAIDSSEKSTQNTDNIVFRQTVDFPVTGVLLEEFTLPPTGTGQFQFDAPAGTLLHPGLLSSSEYSGVSYCTLKPTMKMKPLIGDYVYGFTCFADIDNSGTFDLYFSKGRLQEKSDNGTGKVRYKYQDGPGGAPLKAGIAGNPLKLAKPLPYKVEKGTSTEERFEFIVKFMPSHGFGPHRLEMLKLDEGKETELLYGSKDIPSAEKLPVTMDFSGAKVEVLSVKDGILHYRIKSSLPPDRLIGTDLWN